MAIDPVSFMSLPFRASADVMETSSNNIRKELDEDAEKRRIRWEEYWRWYGRSTISTSKASDGFAKIDRL